MGKNKRTLCINAAHRLDGEEPQPLSPKSDKYCEPCRIKEENRPKIPFDPNALRSF